MMVAQTVKNLPAVWETRVPSLGWEDPLEKGRATHSSILAWKIPWIEEPGGYSPWGCEESDTTEHPTHPASDGDSTLQTRNRTRRKEGHRSADGACAWLSHLCDDDVGWAGRGAPSMSHLLTQQALIQRVRP